MTQMVRQTVITAQLLTSASMLVRICHPADASLHRALEKAETRLMSQAWRVDEGVLHIVSYSHKNDVHLCDGESCSCETTRGVCWHIGAWRILSTLAAAGVDPVAVLPLPICEEALPAGSFLDGPFDAFEDTRLLGDARAGDEWYDQVQSQDAPAAPFKLGAARVMDVDPRLQALADDLWAA